MFYCIKRASFFFLACLFTVSLPAQPGCDAEDLLKKNVTKLDAYKFIKYFPVETNKQTEKVEYSYVLNGDTKYRLLVIDKGTKGEKMMVTVRDRAKKIVATNKDRQNRTYSEVMDFTCPATGVYFFEARFEGDIRDCGLNILGFQK